MIQRRVSSNAMDPLRELNSLQGIHRRSGDAEKRRPRSRNARLYDLLRFHPYVSSTASVDDNHDGVITRISRFEPFVQLAIRLLLYQITSWIHLSFYVYIYIYIEEKMEKGKGELYTRENINIFYNFDTNILSRSISRWIKRENREGERERELSNYSSFLAALNE